MYYRGVSNFSKFVSYIGMIIWKLCAKILARKYKSSVPIVSKYGVIYKPNMRYLLGIDLI